MFYIYIEKVGIINFFKLNIFRIYKTFGHQNKYGADTYFDFFS